MSEKVKFEVDVRKQMGIARFELPNDAAQRLRTGRYRVTMKPVKEEVKGEVKEEPEPKPCPFCGGEARFMDTGDSFRVYIVCRDCSASSAVKASNAAAIAAWNRRT